MGEPAKKRRVRWRTVLGLLLLPLAIGVQWLCSLAPQAVESLYSRTVYPPIVAALASVSSRLPFSITEVALACVGVLAVAALVRTGRALLKPTRPRWRTFGRIAFLSLCGAGAGYGLFLLVWGLNYQRLTFSRSAGLDVRPSDPAELSALAASLVDEANRLRETLPEDEHGTMRLRDAAPHALARAALGVASLIDRYPWLPRPDVHPKAAWTSPLLAYLGVAGFYSPPTAEALIDIDVPPSDVLFAAAHEVGHQLGFAREDEVNYLGYLICRFHPDADYRYSAAFTASLFVLHALALADRAEARALDARRSEAVKRDIAALVAWEARYSGPAMRTFNRANDAYLRSQGQREGVRSYGRMVDLLLAAWRAEHNVPIQRNGP